MKNKKIYILAICLAVVLTGCSFNLTKKVSVPEIKKDAQQTKQDKIENVNIVNKTNTTSTRFRLEECASSSSQYSLEKCLYNKFSTTTITNGVLEISKENIFVKPINEDSIAEIKYNRVQIHDLYGKDNSGDVLVSPNGEGFSVPINFRGLLHEVVASPNNNDLVFASSHSINSPCVNKLYSYNLKKKELTEFYSEIRNGKGNKSLGTWDGDCMILRVAGFQGSKLILTLTGSEEAGAMCTRTWASDYFGELLYIDLANIGGGLKKFTVPKVIEEKANKEVEECSVNPDKFAP